MISFLFFCENRPKWRTPLWCTVPPQVPPSIQSGQQNGHGPRRTVNGRLRTMQRPVSPVSRPPV